MEFEGAAGPHAVRTDDSEASPKELDSTGPANDKGHGKRRTN